MGRKRLPQDEKLTCYQIGLKKRHFDAIMQKANEQHLDLSTYLREYIIEWWMDEVGLLEEKEG